jgi:hypothetical protein
MTENSHKHPNLALDLLIVGLAVALVALSSKLGLQAGHPATRGAGAVLGGVYLIYLGLLFLLSYLFPGICYTFSFMRYVSEECSGPRNRHMALLFFAVGLLFGTWLLMIGLGVL